MNQHRNDYEELKQAIEYHKGIETWEGLCIRFGGHNFTQELFDVNYGTICTTVYNNKGNYKLQNNYEFYPRNSRGEELDPIHITIED